MATRSQPAAVPMYTLLARDSELETLVRMWRQFRLVTLYGQSGVGKSVLVRAAAERVAGETPTAVVRLDAEGVDGGLPVLRLLARARRRHRPTSGLNSDPTDEASWATSPVVPHPTAESPPSPFYVVLDHLAVTAHGAARGIVQWLVEHPEAHLLVVSRWPLEVLGEQSLCLAPLSVAPSTGAPAPALQLFNWCSDPGAGDEGSPGPEWAGQICASLDGLPAATEAAAALVGVLPAEEIARIAREEPLSLSLRGVSLHRVLRATWDDLPPDARQYLRANAVWPASFGDRAGDHMAGLAGSHAVTARLVRMGLLHRTASEPGLRYRLSPLMRHLVMAEPVPSADARRERVVRWLAEEAGRAVSRGGAWSPHPDDLVTTRWAWRWLAGHDNGVAVRQIALALAGPLRHQLGEPTEAEELLQSALAWARVKAPEQVPALQSQLAATERVLGHLDRAERRLRSLMAGSLPPRETVLARLRLAAVLSDRGQHAAALEMRRGALVELRDENPDRAGAGWTGALAWALYGQAVDYQHLGDNNAAGAASGEASGLFDQLGCPYGQIACRSQLALLRTEVEELEEAASHAREARELAEAVGDQQGRARALHVQAQIVGRVDATQGLALAEEAASLWKQLGQPAGLIRSRLEAAVLAQMAGREGDRPIQSAREALALARRHGYRGLEAASLVALAEIYRHLGRAETARDYWQQARAACDQTDAARVRRQCEALGAALRPAEEQRRGRRSVSRLIGAEHAPKAAAPPLTIRLLGAVRVDGPKGVLSSDRLRPKEQRVLARLALQPGRVVLRDELLETFWPGSKVALAERSLRTVVSSLRSGMRSILHEPAPPLIRGRMDGYCMEEAACVVDVSGFIEAVQEARNGTGGDEATERALAAWQRAVDLYQGDLLSAFRYDDWCLAIRERLRDDYLDGLFQLARAAMTTKSLERARELASRMVELEPAEERAHRLLMRCYVLLGRPAEAVRQFERCRAALDEELAARPAAATLALLASIRAGAKPPSEHQADGEPRMA